jgi:type III pantothenate kinase
MSSLLIDAGNTRLKWGVFSAGRCLAKGSVPSAEALALSGQLLAALPEVGPIAQVIACSVAGEAVNTVLAATLPRQLATRVTWFQSAPLGVGGLVNAYQVPTRLGADRWAAAIAAWHRVGRSCLVISAGTATTIDVVRVLQETAIAAAAPGDARAEFAGGVILPGVRMMLTALAARTAQLPEAKGSLRDLPRNTDDAITTGCLEAQLGAIDRMRRRLPPGAPLVLGGGAAPLLAPWLDGEFIVVDDLVLEGLAVVAGETAAA